LVLFVKLTGRSLLRRQYFAMSRVLCFVFLKRTSDFQKKTMFHPSLQHMAELSALVRINYITKISPNEKGVIYLSKPKPVSVSVSDMFHKSGPFVS